jgi:hypothetical protein
MTTRTLETLTADQVRQIAEASELWQATQQAMLDSAGIGEAIDGRAILGPEQTRAAFDEIRTSPTRQALRHLIADLGPAAQLELVGLLWIGREDDDDMDIVTALERADGIENASAVNYIAGRAPLSRYLRRALERTGAE